jgi:hypothetical protein
MMLDLSECYFSGCFWLLDSGSVTWNDPTRSGVDLDLYMPATSMGLFHVEKVVMLLNYGQ